MEIWKRIEGYKPIYEISNLGRVRSISRVTPNARGLYVRKEKFLRVSYDKAGYAAVELFNEQGRKKKCLIHRLVAIHFIDNPDNKPEIDHINGKRDDNRVENLKWCTRVENCNNPLSLEKYRDCKGERSRHKRNIIAYTINGEKVGEWATITMAAEATNTNRHSISYAANGKYKSANNLIWRYNECN